MSVFGVMVGEAERASPTYAQVQSTATKLKAGGAVGGAIAELWDATARDAAPPDQPPTAQSPTPSDHISSGKAPSSSPPRDHRRRRLHVGDAGEVAFADLDQFAGGDQGVDLAADAFLVQVQASGDFADGGGTALGVGGRGVGAGIAPGLSRILGDRLAPSSCAAGSG